MIQLTTLIENHVRIERNGIGGRGGGSPLDGRLVAGLASPGCHDADRSLPAVYVSQGAAQFEEATSSTEAV